MYVHVDTCAGKLKEHVDVHVDVRTCAGRLKEHVDVDTHVDVHVVSAPQTD